MRRINGGFLARNDTPTGQSGPGVWSVSEQFVNAVRRTWPISSLSQTTTYSVDILAIGAGGGGGGADGSNSGGHGGSGGVVGGTLIVTPGQVYSISIGGGGGVGASGTTGGGGAGGANGGGAGGGAGGSGTSGAGGGGGGWTGMFTATTYIIVAGGGAGGGGGGEGTANDTSVGGGGDQRNGVNGTSMTGAAGTSFSGDGGGGGGAGGGYYGGVGQGTSGNSSASGGGNYTNTTYLSNTFSIKGNEGGFCCPSGGTMTNWTGYDWTAGWGFGGFSGGNGQPGRLIIRYPGLQRTTGGTITTASGYTFHTFTATVSGITF